MNDRELLAFAAMAYFDNAPTHIGDGVLDWVRDCKNANWNPLADDGDALRLAVKLEMALDLTIAMQDGADVQATSDAGDFDVECDTDPYAATRRAIVRAAAEIGKAME